MNRPSRRVLSAVAVVMLAAASGSADHIPGHNDGDPTFPMPIPGQEFFSGGVLFVTLIGPDEGTEIFGTDFDIHYVSDGTTPASDIIIDVSLQLETGSAAVTVTGADLGFGSGPGTFTGIFSTDALNGVVTAGFFPPMTTVNLTIDAVGGGIQGTGYFVASTITLDVESDTACPGDTNGDNRVDVNDLVNVITDWGTDGSANNGDTDESGLVNVNDLVTVIKSWGSCP